MNEYFHKFHFFVDDPTILVVFAQNMCFFVENELKYDKNSSKRTFVAIFCETYSSIRQMQKMHFFAQIVDPLFAKYPSKSSVRRAQK